MASQRSNGLGDRDHARRKEPTRKEPTRVEDAVYLVIQRLTYAENDWPGHVDIIMEPAYRDSGAARARAKELAALYETQDKSRGLRALGAKVRFYVRDVSLVHEMEQ